MIMGLDSVDIILGADWLTRHQAVMDIAARAIGENRYSVHGISPHKLAPLLGGRIAVSICP